jgi:UDP-2-acetamido-3-amino-2,3-dideoxy-glucuronate N-acetyltransferase
MTAPRLVDPKALVAGDVQLGEFVVIEAGVKVGAGSVIGHGVVIRRGTQVGAGVRIDDHAVLGKEPMRAANSAVTRADELPALTVGDGSILGTGAVVYRGAVLGERVLVADHAAVRERVTIGDRTIVGRGVTIENDCTIGRFVKIETGAYITAYSVLENRVFIAPMVATSNDRFIGRTEERFKHFKGVTVKRGGRVGVGAVILPGITIGPDGVVAAGSVVSRDVPAQKLVMGSPARIVRDVAEAELLDRQIWDDVRRGES